MRTLTGRAAPLRVTCRGTNTMRSLSRHHAIALTLVLAGCGQGMATGGDIVIRAESTHAEHVSGGDVLLSIQVEPGSEGALEVLRDGTPVSDAFQADPSQPGRWLGLLEGIPEGSSEVVARVGDRRGIT